MPIVTNRWKEDKFAKNGDGQWTAEKHYDVWFQTDPTLSNETAAIAAVPFTLSPGSASPASVHPLNPYMPVKSIVVGERTSLTLWHVVVNFTLEPGPNANANGNPILDTPRYKWERGSETIQIDRDWNNNAILNLAGSLFYPPPSLCIGTTFMRIQRNEPAFDPVKSDNFNRSVNSADVTILGYTFGKGKVHLIHYIQLDWQSKGFLFSRCEYYLEFRPAGMFKVRVLNVGRVGWADFGNGLARGPLCYTDNGGNAIGIVSEDVALDIHGKPVDTAIEVLGPDGVTSFTPENNPQLSMGTNPYPGLVVEDFTGTGGGIVLTYDGYTPLAYSGLGLPTA